MGQWEKVSARVQCHKVYPLATLVLIKPRLYGLLCALYFCCFLSDPGIALCFRFFGGYCNFGSRVSLGYHWAFSRIER